jgi:hypothetical protein
MLTPLDRAYTFGMCKAIVRGCTKANAQIDPNVMRRIQEVSNGLAAALMWYSEMEFVGANAIINADEKARIEAIAHANFETTDCLNVSANVNADGMFKVISSDMAEMIFFEKVMTLTFQGRGLDRVRAQGHGQAQGNCKVVWRCRGQ